MTETKENHALENAKAGLESIKKLMAALKCDYERLEELRDMKDGFTPTNESGELWDELEEADELKQLEAAAGDCADRDDSQQRIDEYPLSIEVRSDWHAIGEEAEDAEYCILLTTGGPALRLIGELRNGEPHSARLEYQDWWKPWTELVVTGDDHDALVAYASCFCWEH